MKINLVELAALSSLLLATVPLVAHADPLAEDKPGYVSYTYVEGTVGALSLKDNTAGSSSTSTIAMVGVNGSYGFDHLFDFGKYLDATGGILAGSGTISGAGTLTLAIAQAGVGAHADFHPAAGSISLFVNAEEQSTSSTFMSVTNTNSSSLIVYGIKWLILDSYEWDFYGTSQGGSSSSSSSSPVGGNTLNLQLTWVEHPNAAGKFIGAQYQHQSQSGSSSDSIFVVGGYRW